MTNSHLDLFCSRLYLLSKLLNKIQAHVQGDEQILFERLAPDMFPLGTQVEIAVSFTLRASCPIAGADTVSFKHETLSFTHLQHQISQTIAHLQTLDTLDNDLNTSIRDMAGPTPVVMVAQDFLSQFAYPNFYFHFAMVYAIARMHGVPLSKGDFDDIHQYPPGFSFE